MLETWKTPDVLGLHPRDVYLFASDMGIGQRAMLAARGGEAAVGRAAGAGGGCSQTMTDGAPMGPSRQHAAPPFPGCALPSAALTDQPGVSNRLQARSCCAPTSARR